MNKARGWGAAAKRAGLGLAGLVLLAICDQSLGSVVLLGWALADAWSALLRRLPPARHMLRSLAVGTAALAVLSVALAVGAALGLVHLVAMTGPAGQVLAAQALQPQAQGLGAAIKAHQDGEEAALRARFQAEAARAQPN